MGGALLRKRGDLVVALPSFFFCYMFLLKTTDDSIVSSGLAAIISMVVFGCVTNEVTTLGVETVVKHSTIGKAGL